MTATPQAKNEAGPGPTRRCIASGEILPTADLIRFVVGPNGEVVPDLAGKLPGRGLWVRSTSADLALAVKKSLFARAAKAPARTPGNLEEIIISGLLRRLSEGLGLAARAGHLTTGFEKVRDQLKSGKTGVLVEAADGAADGRDKVFALAHGVGKPIYVLGCLNSADLDLALGRSNVIHAAISAGPLADRLGFDMTRLAGFRPLAPPDWRLPGASDEVK